MTKNEILSKIMEIPGATMARANKANFVAIPTEDGCVKVSIGVALAADTKNHKAFNMDAAVAEYKAWEAETALKAAEKASKPKTVKGPNPVAVAHREEIDGLVTGLPAFTEYTATDIWNAIGGKSLPSYIQVMQVGQSAKRLVEKGVLVVTSREGDKKSYYTKI